MRLKAHWPWIAFSLAALLILAVPLPARSAAPAERTFMIQASQFQYTPAVLSVHPGDRVTIELQALDVVHGFALDGYGQEMSADPGQPARISFVADRTGTFRFRCSVTCGNMHPFMMGKLTVGDNSLLLKASALGILMVGFGFWKLWK